MFALLLIGFFVGLPLGAGIILLIHKRKSSYKLPITSQLSEIGLGSPAAPVSIFPADHALHDTVLGWLLCVTVGCQVHNSMHS